MNHCLSGIIALVSIITLGGVAAAKPPGFSTLQKLAHSVGLKQARAHTPGVSLGDGRYAGLVSANPTTTCQEKVDGECHGVFNAVDLVLLVVRPEKRTWKLVVKHQVTKTMVGDYDTKAVLRGGDYDNDQQLELKVRWIWRVVHPGYGYETKRYLIIYNIRKDKVHQAVKVQLAYGRSLEDNGETCVGREHHKDLNKDGHRDLLVRRKCEPRNIEGDPAKPRTEIKRFIWHKGSDRFLPKK